MNEQQMVAAEAALAAVYDATMEFPAIVGTLITAGFEGYTVDFRCKTCAYYLPNGDSIELRLPPDDGRVAAEFFGEVVKAAIREAQRGSVGYTYEGFCRNVSSISNPASFRSCLVLRI